MKKNKITEIDGWGTLTGAEGDRREGLATATATTYTCDNLIIATGATVRMLPGMSVSENVVTYEEQILDENLPGSIIIGGSGAIGVEFAYVMKNFGVDVTIVEFLDRMVPTEDADVSKELLKHYKKLGVKVLLSHQGRLGRGHRLRRQGHRQPRGRRRRAGARGRQDARRVRLRPAGRGLRPRGRRRRADRPRRDRDRRPRPHQRRRRLRDRRLHREDDARPRRRGDGHRRRRDDRRRRDHGDRLRHDPAGDVLPAADRLVRLLRGSRPRRRGTTSRRRRSRSRPTARPRASATRSAS